jgi:hypothetical protein
MTKKVRPVRMFVLYGLGCLLLAFAFVYMGYHSHILAFDLAVGAFLTVLAAFFFYGAIYFKRHLPRPQDGKPQPASPDD